MSESTIKPNEETMKSLPFIVAVDFDGTLCSQNFPEIGEADLELIKMLKDWRYEEQDVEQRRLILWTCRDNHTEDRLLDKAIMFCTANGLEFDAVNRNCDEVIAMFNNDTRKVYANEYVDDKSINYRFGDAKPQEQSLETFGS